MASKKEEPRWGAAQVIAVIIIIAVILVVVFSISMGTRTPVVPPQPGGGSGANVEQVRDDFTVTRAPEGQVVANFPEEFLVEGSASIEESFSVDYQGRGADQPVVRYISARSLADNVSAFADILTTNEWELLHEADSSAETTTFFYGRKPNADVNITFVQNQDDRTEVTISYLEK